MSDDKKITIVGGPPEFFIFRRPWGAGLTQQQIEALIRTEIAGQSNVSKKTQRR